MEESLQYQEIQTLTQETEDAIEKFFTSPCKNARALSFLNGKAMAYRKVLEILEKREGKRNERTNNSK